MKLRKYLVFLGLFLIQVYSAFAASVQDAFLTIANVFTDFDIYEIYQIAPRFIDFIVVLVILLRVMKFEKVVKALGGESSGKKTGTIIAVVMSIAVFALPGQYGISTLAIGVLGLFLLAGIITTTITSFTGGWFWDKGFAGKAFVVTFAMLVFGATMHLFGGGNLNGLAEVSQTLAGLVELIYSLGLLSFIFIWFALFSANGPNNDTYHKSPIFDKVKNAFSNPDKDITQRKPKRVDEENNIPDYSKVISRLNREVESYIKSVQENKISKLPGIETKIQETFYDIINTGEQFTRIKSSEYTAIGRIMLAYVEAKKDAVQNHGVSI